MGNTPTATRAQAINNALCFVCTAVAVDVIDPIQPGRRPAAWPPRNPTAIPDENMVLNPKGLLFLLGSCAIAGEMQTAHIVMTRPPRKARPINEVSEVTIDRRPKITDTSVKQSSSAF